MNNKTFCMRIYGNGANRHVCTGGPCCKGDCQPKFAVVWTEKGRQFAELFATQKMAEAHNGFYNGHIFTRRQFETLTTAAERKALLAN